MKQDLDNRLHVRNGELGEKSSEVEELNGRLKLKSDELVTAEGKWREEVACLQRRLKCEGDERRIGENKLKVNKIQK